MHYSRIGLLFRLLIAQLGVLQSVLELDWSLLVGFPNISTATQQAPLLPVSKAQADEPEPKRRRVGLGGHGYRTSGLFDAGAQTCSRRRFAFVTASSRGPGVRVASPRGSCRLRAQPALPPVRHWERSANRATPGSVQRDAGRYRHDVAQLEIRPRAVPLVVVAGHARLGDRCLSRRWRLGRTSNATAAADSRA